MVTETVIMMRRRVEVMMEYRKMVMEMVAVELGWWRLRQR